MTHAGTITVGVEIDASAIRAELTSAIREAVLPAIAEMNRDLDTGSRGYTQMARSAENSATKQVLALNRVIRKLRDAKRAALEYRAALGGDNGTTGGAGRGAGGFGKTTIRNDNRTINNNRIDNRSDRRVITNNYYRGSSDNSGGGGGSGGGRSSSGGGGGRGGGALGFLTSPLGLNALALGASALPAATTAVVNLVGAVQALGQAGLAVPGIFAGIATSAGTAAFGFKGVADAVKALNEAAGDPKKLKEAEAALKDLAPAAVEVAKSVSAFTQGPLKDLQKAVAQPLLDGVAEDFDSFTSKVLPRAQAGMTKVATAINGSIKELLRVGGTEKTGGIMDRIFGNTADAQGRFTKAIEPLVNGFGTLAAAGSDFLPRLADGLGKLATRFDNFITKADKGGRLAKWIDEGFKAAGNLGEALLNIGKIITDITGAAGGDGGFLKWLRDATGALREFTSSDEGQAKLTKFFEDGKAKLDQWLPVLKNAVSIAGDVVAGFQRWGDIILPVIASITQALAGLGGDGGGALAALVTGFLAFKTLSPFANLLTDLNKVDGKVSGLTGKLGALKKIGIIGGLGLGIDGAVDAGQNGLSGTNALEAAGGGAIAGFSAGGPVGALIGALTGLTAAVIADRVQREGGVKADAANVQRVLDGPDSQRIGIGNSVLPITDAQIDQAKKTALRDFNIRQATGVDPLTGKSNTPVQLPSNLQRNVDLGNNSQASQAARDALIASGATNAADLNDRIGRAKDTLDKVNRLPAGSTSVAASGDIQINDPTPAILANVKQLGLAIENLPGGKVVIKDNSDEISNNVDALKRAIANIPGSANIVVRYTDPSGNTIDPSQLRTPIRVPATPGGSVPIGGGGRAYGGPIFGGIKGVDSVPILAQHGEFVLDTGDVARMGGVAGVEQFRRGLENGAIRRFAEGGPVIGSVPGLGPLPGPDPAGDNSVVGLLSQIRDLLAGKGGPASNPLAQTADGVQSLVTAGGTAGSGGTDIGPFGTPRKRGNPAYDAAAAAISALGGDPEKFLGADPSTYAVGGTGAGAGAITGGVVSASVAAALKAFATSGDTSALAGTGLGINDPVVTALTAARNKGKGGLDDSAIAGLVDQVLTGGGFSGTLDTSNTALVKALTKYRDKATGIKGGTAAVAGATGVPMTALPGIDAAILAQIPAGSYTSGPGDLTKGLADCSSAVEDLVDIIDGQPTAGRTVNTGNEADFLLSRGFIENTTGANVPGALNIGLNASHTQATLPGGTNFNWGSQAAAAAAGLNGDGAFGAGLTRQFYRPVGAGGIAAGMPGMDTVGGSLAAGAVQSVFVTNWPGQPVSGGPGAPGGLGGAAGPGGATNYLGKSIVDAATQGVGGVGGDLSGIGIDALNTALNGDPNDKRGPNAGLNALVSQRNPNALAAAAGLNVEDFTRQGGDGAATDANTGPGFDASGRVYSDTASLLDRTFTDLLAANKAQFDQTIDVLNQLRDKLSEDVLKPVVADAVTEGIGALSDRITGAIGTQLGNTSAPIIASAVKSAIPTQTPDGGSNTSGTGIGGVVSNLFAAGGPVSGGVPNRDSVPALLMPGEHVFTTTDVARLGGQAGVYAFRRALAAGNVRGFATGGGVSGNATVGADFFGVSQIPIIGAIVNLLVQVLLAVIGVNIEVRDTLDEMASEVRGFRGDFEKFDATGRLVNDTSSLLDRTGSSEQAAADERIRILKQVIQGLVKFIIEKIIVPIGKAVANAAIQAGASAAGAAINTQAPGAGGIVSSLISSAGSAGVDIVGDLFSSFSVSLSQVLIDAVGQGLQSYFPDLTTGLFGGNFLAAITDPISSILDGFLGGFTGIFTGLFGGLATLIPGLPFDNGGLANGMGWLPKATVNPERVLSPEQTQSFERWLNGSSRSAPGGNTSTTTVHAPITMIGGSATPESVRNHLLAKLS